MWLVAVSASAAPVTVRSGLPSLVRDVRLQASRLGVALGVPIEVAVEAPRDDGVAVLGLVDGDIRALFGLLAATADGPRWASRMQRAGLDRLDAIRLRVERDKSGAVAATGRLGPLAPRALEVFGPPRAWGAWRATGVSGAAVMLWTSVRPAVLWGTLARLANLEDPVTYGLYRVQLDALADELGVDWHSALGREAQAGVLCRLPGESRGAEWGAALAVADPRALTRLFAAYGALLARLGAPIAVQGGPGAVTLVVDANARRSRASPLLFRFGDGAVGVANSDRALRCATQGVSRSSTVATTGGAVAIAARRGAGRADALGVGWDHMQASLDGDTLVFDLRGMALGK